MKFSFTILAIVATTFLTSFAWGQSDRAQQIIQEQRARMEKMRENARQSSQDAMARHQRMVDDLKTNGGRSRPSALDVMGVSEEQAQREMQEFDRQKSRQNSSSSSSGVRIRGRSIRGILVLVGLLFAGLMKLASGFRGGNQTVANADGSTDLDTPPQE